MRHAILWKLIYIIYSKKEHSPTYHMFHFQRLSSPIRKTFNSYYSTSLSCTNYRKFGLLWVYIPINQDLSRFSCQRKRKKWCFQLGLKMFNVVVFYTGSKRIGEFLFLLDKNWKCKSYYIREHTTAFCQPSTVFIKLWYHWL